jgi:AmiR/NasT family two-component response regulator
MSVNESAGTSAAAPDLGELLERAEEARLRAQALVERSTALQATRVKILEGILRTEDLRLDLNIGHDARLERNLERARRMSVRIGRDPDIEDAKVLLARRSGCTPSEAYRLLVELSQRSNRRVRAVASEVVAAYRPPS